MTAVLDATVPAVARPDSAPPAPPWAVRRARELAGTLLLCALAFSQAGGQLVADTKLDLALDPGGFLARALQAWDSQAAFGQVQNQAYGYLWPMGPFFLLGHALHIPAWAVQRLWWCLLLLVAYVGMLLLLRALRAGTPTSRLVAALAFALTPRILTTLGGISVESWPGAVVPWILLPLVLGSRSGSPRRAAALSALAVACLGGVNATASAVALVLPALYLLTRERGPRRNRLAAWWTVLTLAAVAWWVLPLLLMSRYSYPFLAFIESATTTTAPLSTLDNVRGTSHWLGFLVLDGSPSWPAGWWLSSAAVAVIATSLLGALGLLGVLARSCPERRFLRVSILVGLTFLGVGYAGALGSPVAPWVHAALDGWAAPLRNVHKFDVVVRLPLTVGLAVLVPLALPAVHRAVRRAFVDRGGPSARRASALVAVLVVALPLAVVASPAVRGELPQYGSFEAVPGPWTDAASWLAEHGPDDRTLLLPASNFGEYAWGRPRDEPFQALARSPWGVRNIVPLGAPGATRWLDAVQAVVAEGGPSADLAPALRGAGVRYLLLRTDLDPSTGVLDPTIVRATLLSSPGLRRAVSFDDPRSGDGAASTDAVGVEHLPQIEIYEVLDPGTRVSAVPDSALQVFSGGPEALVTAGLAARPGAWIALSDAPDAPDVVVTDTLRRRLMNVGAQRGSDYSSTLTAATPVSRGGAAGDISPWPSGTDETVLQYAGITDVKASSSTADPFSAGYLGPEFRAFSAIDGVLDTEWLAAPSDPFPWWKVTFPSREVANLRLRLAAPDEVSAVTVVTDAGKTRVEVGAAQRDGLVDVALPPGRTTSVEVQLETLDRRTRPTGLTEVVVPGLTATETREAAAAVGVAGAVFSRAPGARRPCVPTSIAWACSPLWGRLGEEVAPFARAFRTTTQVSLRPSVRLRARQGTSLDSVADATLGLTVTGSSRLVEDVVARPGAALDEDPATAWIPSVTDLTPSLEVRYPTPITAARVSVDDGLARAAFTSVVVTVGGRTVEAPLTAGAATFPALTGDRWRIQLRRATNAEGRISVPRVNVSLGQQAARNVAAVRVGCSDGLHLDVDGVRHPVELTADLRDVVRGGVLVATTCDTSVLTLAAGTHQLTSTSTSAFAVAGITLGAGDTANAGGTVPVRVRAWAAEARSVSLPPGDADVLMLSEGYNNGWVATLDGQTLPPVRLDGWRQGWRVPAAESRRDVEISYVPGTTQRVALAIGALLALLVAVAALRPGRSALPPSPAARRGRPATTQAITLLVPGLLASWPGLLVGAGALVTARYVGSRQRAFVAAAAASLAGVVAAGWAASWGGTPVAAVVQLLAVAAVALLAVSGRDDPVSVDPADRAPHHRSFDDEPGRSGNDHAADQGQ